MIVERKCWGRNPDEGDIMEVTMCVPQPVYLARMCTSAALSGSALSNTPSLLLTKWKSKDRVMLQGTT